MSVTVTSLCETNITLASSLSSDASLVRQALLDHGLETPHRVEYLTRTCRPGSPLFLYRFCPCRLRRPNCA